MATKESESEKLSKGLSWFLRHAVHRPGVMRPDGFVDVDFILKQTHFTKYSKADIKTFVADQTEYCRFQLKHHFGKMYIRVIQYHYPVQIDKPKFAQICSTRAVPSVIYPTSFQNWQTYMSNGFCRKRDRAFIYFFLHDPNKEYKTDGEFPPDVFIYIDLRMALKKLEFFRGEHNLILTRGNDEGIVEPKYIDKVVNIRTGESFPIH